MPGHCLTFKFFCNVGKMLKTVKYCFPRGGKGVAYTFNPLYRRLNAADLTKSRAKSIELGNNEAIIFVRQNHPLPS